MKILVVDDFPTMRKIVKSLLGQLGFKNFTEAEDGAEALEILKTHPEIEMVVSDWNMPKMSGRELLEKVRATPSLHHLPFIMITGENASDMVRNAIAGGVTDFIVKPFTGALLEHRVKLALSQARPAPKVV